MSTKPRAIIAVVVLIMAGASTVAAGTLVRVRVAPSKAIAGEQLTVTASTGSAARRCSVRITRPGAPATALPRRAVAKGSVAWRWTLPVAAKAGVGTALVACQPKSSGSARFSIRALPSGDLDAGKTVFVLNCGGCHTLADAGTTGTSVDLDQRMPSYERTVDRVVNGKGLMPSFKSRLSPQEIADVATYVSTVAGQ